ncbi:MAG: hypothetical protein ACI9BC_000152, partial [Crocinitomicaceae bacterium]
MKDAIKFGGRSLTAVVCALALTACSQERAIYADVIYIDGNIITVNDAQPSAQAIAIKDGLI